MSGRRQRFPDEWAGAAEAPKGQPSAATAGEPELTQWWLQFNDPTMTGLVEEALKASLDLKTAEAVVRQARASRGITFGALWPSVGSSAGYQRARTTNSPSDQNLFQAGLDAVWELDIFGGLHRNLEAADASVEAAVENMHDVQVSLVAEVALNYIQLRGYQQEILVAQKSLQAQQQTADITRKLFNAGFDTAIDVANADAAVATTEAQIPVYEIAARQSIYALSIMLARPPADLLKQLSPPAGLPSVPTQVPDWFTLRLAAPQAGCQGGRSAVACRYGANRRGSRRFLSAVFAYRFGKLEQQSAANVVEYSQSHVRRWTVGHLANFPGRATAANVRLQEALRDQAFIAYQKTVLTAFQDVENALTAFVNEQQHRTLLGNAVAANRKAVALSLELYTGGQNNFLTVTIAQQSLYTAENALVQSNCNIATDLIALYKALGGGGEPLPSRADTPKDAM